MDILEAAGDLIRTAVKTKTCVTVDRGEWELFVHAWTREQDLMAEAEERQDARQGGEFVRVHEQRMAAV